MINMNEVRKEKHERDKHEGDKHGDKNDKHE